MTNEELLLDYLQVMNLPALCPELHGVLIMMVAKMRLEEPRITNGTHLMDYCAIIDDEGTMDSCYGKDYFVKNA